ncbi:MAG TPA: M23 family metallopeptidase [Chitinophagaceae bacterium]|nr:M23 family metallopeptidase [Chitinophagaceae bacterium]
MSVNSPWLFVLLLLGFIPESGNTQSLFPAKNYPQHYQLPLHIPFSLAGNFGECRPDHFHSGIDIRTQQIENIPVYAIEDGFVSRVKIEAGGFGNAIYITHPGGYTSVYAHLNRFFPALEEYVRRRQYEEKSWKQDIIFMPHQFPLRQGEFIAYSGNTGSSEGPHLHLEIRDTRTEHPLNPLLFFSNTPDTKAPRFESIALYQAGKSIYEQDPFLISCSTQNEKCTPKKELIYCSDTQVFLGIAADDYMENALGTLGVYEMNLWVDDSLFFGWQLDDIGYDITRYMNSMADYSYRKKQGRWIQLCSSLPGDHLPVYADWGARKGVIDLSDGKIHSIKITIRDVKGNSSDCRFRLKHQGKSTIKPACKLAVTPQHDFHIKDERLEIHSKTHFVYDTLCFYHRVEKNKQGETVIQILNGHIPMHETMDLSFKPFHPLQNQLKEKYYLYRMPYGKENKGKGMAVSVEKDRIHGRLREFGTYVLRNDTVAPVIQTEIRDGDSIGNCIQLDFTVNEESTSMAGYEASVDGQWLRLVQKGNRLSYELDSYFPEGRHLFVLQVMDENKNKRELKLNLIK